MINPFDYLTISKSKLFDPSYYLLTYEDVRVADMDPIRHYLIAGWKEGRNPSADFNTRYYLNQNKDVADNKMNPLIHYIRYGRTEGRQPAKPAEESLSPIAQPAVFSTADLQMSSSGVLESKPLFSPKATDVSKSLGVARHPLTGIALLPFTEIVDIIICAGPNTKNIAACIESIRRNTRETPYNLHIVAHENDLHRVKATIGDGAIFHSHLMDNFNYSKANNIVFSQVDNDVVLLNDDTEVTESWLEKLREASGGVALTGAHTGTHCSGNPDMWEPGPTRLTEFPINMFCAYIPKRLKQVVGLLDEQFVFYGGEDVDYSIRALQNGFPLVVSDAFVVHKDNQSFGQTKERLMQESDKLLFEKYQVNTPFNLADIRPKVSVIIPTRNRPALLREAVYSIQKSEYKNFEIIVVDDGSNKETQEEIFKLQGKFYNLISIRMPENGGAAKARQIGINASTGHFIVLSDDDDTVLTNRISAPLSHLIDNPNLDVVYCNFNILRDGGRVEPIYCQPFNRNEYLDLKFNIGLGILLGRKKVFTDVPLHTYYNNAGDYDWVFRIDRKGYKIDLCPEIVMNYNRTGPVEAHLAGTAEAISKHREVRERELLLQEIKRKD